MPQLYLTSSQIDSAVRKLYSKNGYIVLSQVRNGTGYERRQVRTADMVAISTWPSRGLSIEGIEVKSDKSDLRREIENPAKADAIATYCHSWWLAFPTGLDEGVMIPPNWGTISVNEKLVAKITKPASALEPKPMDALLVCSILRNFSEGYIPLAEVEPRIQAAREEERKVAQSNKGYREKELEDILKDFSGHSGIDLRLHRWTAGKIGEAVKLIVALQDRPISEILRARQCLSDGLAGIDAALSALDNSPKLK